MLLISAENALGRCSPAGPTAGVEHRRKGKTLTWTTGARLLLQDDGGAPGGAPTTFPALF